MSVSTETVPLNRLSSIETAPTSRLVSLDLLRGATIAGMILVNNPGSWESVFPPLRHAEWHGWTPTDLVFPFFLFVVGVSIVFAYRKRLSAGVPRGPLTVKVFRRTAILFGLGLFLNAFPFVGFTFGGLRIMGVLQRIALCFMAAALLFLYTKPRTQMIVLWSLLLVYWLAMALIPVPGGVAGVLDVPEGTLAAWLDRVMIGQGHLYAGADHLWDPEGVLSTLPAVSTALLGIWTGYLLTDDRDRLEKVAVMLLRGFGLIVLGYVWNWFFPINKKIWTSSYVVFTGGLAMCFLAACYWIVDIKQRTAWTKPFVIFGMNAIAVYVLSGIVADLVHTIPVGERSLAGVVYDTIYRPIGTPEIASLLWAISFVALMYLCALILYRRRIFIKV